MRYLLVSDIHGNLPALQSVLEDAPAFDAIWCLGDLVGYGPNPNEVIKQLREFPLVSVVGNHDWGALGRVDPYVFNADARHALLWTQTELTKENRRFLTELPAGLEVEGYVLVHASLREPIWEYLLDLDAARKNFAFDDFQIAFMGHTHIPLVFESVGTKPDARVFQPDYQEPLSLDGRRLLINPGSVGQPRDGNPQAAYGILDTDEQSMAFRRVAYPIEITQERMRKRGLPVRLIDRLEVGH